MELILTTVGYFLFTIYIAVVGVVFGCIACIVLFVDFVAGKLKALFNRFIDKRRTSAVNKRQ